MNWAYYRIRDGFGFVASRMFWRGVHSEGWHYGSVGHTFYVSENGKNIARILYFELTHI